MKALAFMETGKVSIIEKPIPDLGPNDAVIKTTAALICTSDVHTVKGVIAIPPGRVLGHESVGIVYKAGANVTRCKEGDRVTVCGEVTAAVATPDRAVTALMVPLASGTVQLSTPALTAQR